ncbi:MAG: site-specific integrase [Syntrophales bacterium]
MSKNKPTIGFPALIQDFFCQRLIAQQNASPQTIASYRDTFRLFFQYTKEKMNKEPASLRLPDINAQLVLDFLDYLENERGNTQRSRNLRLAAIRSFMHYASYRDIESLSTIHKVLAIPQKRFDRSAFEFLSSAEVDAMHLLQSGVDITVIALWLGHESPVTTHMYVEADLTMKEQALKRIQDPSLESVRYQAKDAVLAFLESL